MKELALTLPGVGQVQGYPFLKPELSGASLGQLITQFTSLAVMVMAVLMFLWFVWGAFEYILARGNKDALGKARGRMTWAIIGFVLFIASFAVSQWVATLLTPKNVVPTQTRFTNQEPVKIPGGGGRQNGVTR